jgi:uncharacterized protein YdeI (YjbR/CyaY-like superfamily)
METSKTVYCPNIADWREWLAKHHDSVREIWLLFPKKSANKPCVSYSDALDEALCHGWIDSLIKRIDTDWYARKFTPRTNNQKWSELNKQRVAKLTKQQRMLPVGIEKFQTEQISARGEVAQKKPELPSTVPPFIRRALKKNAKALDNFNKLAPSHRRRYLGWIMFAKREETRQKRLNEAIALLAANQKLGLK